MNETAPAPEGLQPLTFGEKAKAAAKGFGAGVMHYLPRGLLLSGIIFGGSALLEATTGIGGLGVLSSTPTSLIMRDAMALTISGAFFGGIAAYDNVKNTEEARKREIAAQASGQQPQRAAAPAVEQAYSAGFVPQNNLPLKTADATRTP